MSTSSKSPLWMLTQDSSINNLLLALQDAKNEYEKNGRAEITLSKEELKIVRERFSAIIRSGERSLHIFCERLGEKFLTDYIRQSVVIGEVPVSGERFTLVQPISEEDIYNATDLDLGTSQLRKIRMWDGQEYVEPILIANVIEYLPKVQNDFAIHRMVSRVKAEEEIWNKVTDEIFELDSLVEKDKELVKYSRFVKDVFGVKFAVETTEGCLDLHNSLKEVLLTTDSNGSMEKIEFIETKDYLSEGKKSGWEALKSVVSWRGKMYELQIQPLNNFLLEREERTKESHSSFKLTRESVRNEVAKKIPLFGYMRDLLKWAFLESRVAPPVTKGVDVILTQ